MGKGELDCGYGKQARMHRRVYSEVDSSVRLHTLQFVGEQPLKSISNRVLKMPPCKPARTRFLWFQNPRRKSVPLKIESSIKDPPISIFLFFYLFYFPLSSSTSNSLLAHAPLALAPPAPAQRRCHKAQLCRPPASRDVARPQPLVPSAASFCIASSNSGLDRLWRRCPRRAVVAVAQTGSPWLEFSRTPVKSAVEGCSQS
jgi:hypothetical protein